MATMYSPDKAEWYAAILNAAEKEEAEEDSHNVWTYTAVHAPDGEGLSRIEVRDEWGVLVGKL